MHGDTCSCSRCDARRAIKRLAAAERKPAQREEKLRLSGRMRAVPLRDGIDEDFERRFRAAQRPPKPARAVTLAELQDEARTKQPTGFKTVGGGTALVYTETENFYVSDGERLRDWLWKTYGLD